MLSDDNNAKLITRFIEELRHYLVAFAASARVSLVEMLVRIVKAVIIFIISMTLIVVALIYFSVATVLWMAPYVGTANACLICGGGLLLILLLIFALKDVLIVGPLKRFFISLLIDEGIQLTERYKAELSMHRAESRHRMSDMWQRLTAKPKEESRKEMMMNMVNGAFTAIDLYLLFRKLRGTLGSLFRKRK